MGSAIVGEAFPVMCMSAVCLSLRISAIQVERKTHNVVTAVGHQKYSYEYSSAVAKSGLVVLYVVKNMPSLATFPIMAG